jgi:hypothetical protein
MKRFFVGACFLLCAAVTFWNGILEIGIGLHRSIGYACLALAVVSMVYVSMIEDLLLPYCRREATDRAGRD